MPDLDPNGVGKKHLYGPMERGQASTVWRPEMYAQDRISMQEGNAMAAYYHGDEPRRPVVLREVAYAQQEPGDEEFVYTRKPGEANERGGEARGGVLVCLPGQGAKSRGNPDTPPPPPGSPNEGEIPQAHVVYAREVWRGTGWVDVDSGDALDGSYREGMRQEGAELVTEYKEGGEWIEALSLDGETKEFEKFGELVGDMHWEGQWAPGDYRKGSVVLDVGWQMIANKDTAQRPAPQPDGDVESMYPVDPTFTDQIFTGVVWSGAYVEFTRGCWITEIRCQVPHLSADTNYRFIIVDATIPDAPVYTVIEEPVLVEDQWVTLWAGRTPVVLGTKLYVLVDALNSGGSSPVTGGWRYDGSSNVAPPGAQGWNHDPQQAILRMDRVDLDSVDRTAELMGMIPGTTIQFAQTSNPDANMSYRVIGHPVDQGTHIEWAVQLTSENLAITPGEPCTMDADVPVPQPTEYKEEVGYYGTHPQPSWGTITGHKEYDGVSQPGVEQNAYGIEVVCQPAIISEDWDVMAYSDELVSIGSSQSVVEITDRTAVAFTPQAAIDRLRQSILDVNSPTPIAQWRDAVSAAVTDHMVAVIQWIKRTHPGTT